MRHHSRSFVPRRWWSSLWQRSRSVRPRRERLRLEPLEDRIMPTGPTLTDLASFDGSPNGYPFGGVIVDSGGNLYGTATSSAAPNDGEVFEVVNGSGVITPLADFDGTNGAVPRASLLMDANGNLYGTARQ